MDDLKERALPIAQDCCPLAGSKAFQARPFRWHASVGDWIAFADAQTGRLDQASGRTADAIAIFERCEAREREALKREGRLVGRVS